MARRTKGDWLRRVEALTQAIVVSMSDVRSPPVLDWPSETGILERLNEIEVNSAVEEAGERGFQTPGFLRHG